MADDEYEGGPDQLAEKMDQLDEHLADSARLEAQTQEFKEAVAEEKAKGAGKNNPYVRLPFPHHLRS